jgi:hypothetical protein
MSMKLEMSTSRFWRREGVLVFMLRSSAEIGIVFNTVLGWPHSFFVTIAYQNNSTLGQ